MKNYVVGHSNIHDKFVSSYLTCKLKIYKISGNKKIDIRHFLNRQNSFPIKLEKLLVSVGATVGMELLATTHADKHMAKVLPTILRVMLW